MKHKKHQPICTIRTMWADTTEFRGMGRTRSCKGIFEESGMKGEIVE